MSLLEFLKLPYSGNAICRCNSLPIANFIFILQFLVEWFQGDHYFEHLCQHCHCHGTKCQQTSEDLGSWYIQHTRRCQGITFIQFNLPQTCLVVLWKPVVLLRLFTTYLIGKKRVHLLQACKAYINMGLGLLHVIVTTYILHIHYIYTLPNIALVTTGVC